MFLHPLAILAFHLVLRIHPHQVGLYYIYNKLELIFIFIETGSC